jgi:ribonuclease HI
MPRRAPPGRAHGARVAFRTTARGDAARADENRTAGARNPAGLCPGACGRYPSGMDALSPPTDAPWKLFADGASRGNPGPAAAGFVLDAPDGRPAAAGGIALGAATNNVAEYRALVAGLARALELGVTAIDVRMDSELVVRQMTGVYRVKNEGLKPLYAEAQALSRRFARFHIRHVPREQNARADAEANRALDA